MRAFFSLLLGGLIFASCVSVSPGTSTAPINIPSVSVPSIAIPSVSVPSIAIPSIAIPSISVPSIAIPSFAIPSIELPTGLVIPTVPPIQIPSLPTGQNACDLITAEEAAAAFGAPVTFAPADAACNLTPEGEFIPITMRYGAEGETIAVARSILDEAEDLTVAGNPALFGQLFGDVLYVEKGGRTLVFQAAIQEGKRDILVALATAAIARFP